MTKKDGFLHYYSVYIDCNSIEHHSVLAALRALNCSCQYFIRNTYMICTDIDGQTLTKRIRSVFKRDNVRIAVVEMSAGFWLNAPKEDWLELKEDRVQMRETNKELEARKSQEKQN